MKQDAHKWTYEGRTFQVGESLCEPLADNAYREAGQLLVWYKKRLYRLGHATGGTDGRVCLHDIYTGAPYWTRQAFVFQVIEQPNIGQLCAKKLSAYFA